MASIHLKNHQRRTYAVKSMEKSASQLRAVIFDCDGVLIDSEPLHLASFKKVLGPQGEKITDEIYNQRYLALDDKGAISKYFADNKKELKIEKLQQLINKKTEIFQGMIKTEGVLPFPAVPEFVMAVSQRYPLAVASGSRRHELELVLESAGIRSYFEVIVSADDVKKGKPNPESFLKAVDELNKSKKIKTSITPNECLVIEDSIDGIKSAHSAGMKCVGVASTFPKFELSHADLIVPNLAALKISQMEDLYHKPPAQKPLPSPQSN